MLRCLIPLNRGRGFSDHIQHEVRPGQHWHVAAIGLEDCCSHTLRDETLQLGLDSTVLRRHDVPTRLRSPRSTFHLLCEQICYRCGMSGPDQLLLCLREITGKEWVAIPFQPTRASATSIWEKISVAGNFSCRLCVVSSASGANAAT